MVSPASARRTICSALAHVRLGHAAREAAADDVLAAVAVDAASPAGFTSTTRRCSSHMNRPSCELSKMARYCSSRTRRSSSACFCAVISRLKASRCGRPSSMTGLSRTSSQCRLPSLLRRCHSNGGQRPELGQLHLAQRLLGGVGEHARAGVGERRAAQLLAAVAVDLAGLGVDVEHGAGVPVVDEDRVFRGLEDRAVARLGTLQRLAGAQPLDLRRGAHREDLEHGFDPVQLGQRAARGHRHDAQRRAVQRHQRMAGVALGALRRARPDRPGTALQARRVGAEALPEHGFAGRAGQRVADVLQDLPVVVHRQHAQRLRLAPARSAR